MDNAIELLLNSYRQLINAYKQQISIASKDRYDEQLDELQEIEKQKQNYKLVIDQLMLHEQQAISASSNQETLVAYIQQLQSLNDQLEQFIQGWHSENSKSLKQVSIHRKTLHTYGGINDPDIISYYFDQKQ